MIFLFYINDFLIIKNQDAFPILSSIAFETVESLRKEKPKSMISGKSSGFRENLWDFGKKSIGNLEMNFGINLNKCF